MAPLVIPGSDWTEGRSDKRAECLSTSKPLGHAPVGAHQPEVGGSGSGSGGCLGWGFTEMENRLWVMTIEIFLGGVEHGDEWLWTFTLEACLHLRLKWVREG